MLKNNNNALARYLRDNGMTIRFFAKRIDRSEGTIQNVLRGLNVDLETALLIEDATGSIVTCRDLRQKSTRKADH